jgi:hypothetical protein
MYAGISTFLQFVISSAKIKYVSVKAINAELTQFHMAIAIASRSKWR